MDDTRILKMKQIDQQKCFPSRLLRDIKPWSGYLNCFIIIGFLSFGCNSDMKYPDANEWTASDVPKREILTGVPIEIDTPIGIRRFKVIDSLMIIYGDTKDDNSKIHIFNLNTNKKLISFGTEGRGPDEFGMVIEIQTNRERDKLYLADVNQRIISVYDLKALLNSGNTSPENRISTGSHNGRGLTMMGNEGLLSETVLGPITPAADNEPMLIRLKIPSGDIQSRIDFPSKEFAHEAISKNVHYSFVYRYYPAVRPDQEKILLVYHYTDLIDILSSELTLEKRIHGPDRFFPSFESSGDGININPKEDARIAFDIPIAGQEEFWVHYSGDLRKAISNSRTVFVFDWSGKLLRSYSFEQEYFIVDVDFDKGIAYGIAQKDGLLYKFDYR